LVSNYKSHVVYHIFTFICNPHDLKSFFISFFVYLFICMINDNHRLSTFCIDLNSCILSDTW
jgi:hypothetical protein